MEVDISENRLRQEDPDCLKILLRDMTTKRNLLWATDDYPGHGARTEMTLDDISCDVSVANENDVFKGQVIQPRCCKAKEIQSKRVRDKAEVFTPLWVVNEQNNLVDEAWFGRKNVFNRAFKADDGAFVWKDTDKKDEAGRIRMPSPKKDEKPKTWQDYVLEKRMEITCGEAPYLVSRYDPVSGEAIDDPKQRVGLLDRKLRIVGEWCETEDEWFEWALKAYQSIYGFEWQGDNLFLARENLYESFKDYFSAKFNRPLMPVVKRGKPCNADARMLRQIAEVIAWNIWQMDGLSFVVPMSCHDEDVKPKNETFLPGFGEPDGADALPLKAPCPGCAKGAFNDNWKFQHNGKPCRIRDWTKPEGEQEEFFYESVKPKTGGL